MKPIFLFNSLLVRITIISILSGVLSIKASAQELGYNIGLNQLGIQAQSTQPLYGFSIGYQLNKHIGIETNLIYSQRTYGSKIQSDYFSFVLMPKFGIFKEKYGIYLAPSLLLNPTLDHSNNQNHTYLSSFQSIGAQIHLRPELIVDAKLGWDIGLTGGYFDQGTYQKYTGPMLILGMKIKVNNNK